MVLDRSLIHSPHTTNEFVDRCLLNFPIYLRQDFLVAHTNALHVQRGIEFNLTLEGEGAFIVDNHIYKQMPGQLLIIPGHLPHQVFIEPACVYKRIVLLIDDVELRKGISSLTPIPDFSWFSDLSCINVRLQPNMYTAIKQLLFSMMEEMKAKQNGWKQMVVSQLIHLTVLVSRSLDAEKLRTKEKQTSKHRHSTVDSMSLYCKYIDQHLHEDISLQSVAEFFQLTPDHLTRIFRREKGITFYQYLLLQRVLTSKRLLLQCPEMSLTDVAYSVGFASSSNFSRTFKSIAHSTPSQFRQQATELL